MDCPKCAKQVVPDSYFCQWCGHFIPAPDRGVKAGLFRRWLALAIDPLIMGILYFVAVAGVGSVSPDLGVLAAFVFPLAYFIWFLLLLRRGLTPGKFILHLQVVNQQTGTIPGFGRMFLREIPGRILSALFLGIGYYWALFDKNAQSWHDKLAGTVVIRSAK